MHKFIVSSNLEEVKKKYKIGEKFYYNGKIYTTTDYYSSYNKILDRKMYGVISRYCHILQDTLPNDVVEAIKSAYDADSLNSLDEIVDKYNIDIGL